VTNARQEPVHYVCQVLDITARAEAQERLELNEAKLAEAQQIARLGAWEWEIATDRVTWSDELYRIYGVRPDRFSGSYGSNLDRVHADDRARVARDRERRRRAPPVEPRLPHRPPRRRAAHDPRPRRGRLRRAGPARRSSRARARTSPRAGASRTRLRAAEQLFRRAFDDAPIGMALIDLEGAGCA
jgi:PAS domain-containing protein